MNIQKNTYTLEDVNGGKPITIFYETDRFVREVMIGKEYEYFLRDSKVFHKNNLTVVDLGCNIGSFSFYIYDKSKEIYAVDLSLGCIELLKMTIEHNGLTKIHPFHQAIAGSNRVVNASSLECTDGGNTIYGNGAEIQAVTLHQFFIKNNIEYADIIKIDVEGAEREIFTSEDFQKVRDKVGVFIGENHSRDDISHYFGSGFSCMYRESLFIAQNLAYG
jgi:FkbM family methyltransferase